MKKWLEISFSVLIIFSTEYIVIYNLTKKIAGYLHWGSREGEGKKKKGKKGGDWREGEEFFPPSLLFPPPPHPSPSFDFLRHILKTLIRNLKNPWPAFSTKNNGKSKNNGKFIPTFVNNMEEEEPSLIQYWKFILNLPFASSFLGFSFSWSLATLLPTDRITFLTGTSASFFPKAILK